jgi:hypothetical protein
MLLLSIIGELRVGTSPRPVMATRLIVPAEQPTRVWLERRTALGPYTSARQRLGEKGQALFHRRQPLLFGGMGRAGDNRSGEI